MFEILKMSLATLKENLLRTLLTMLAIIVGVFAIIGAVTAVSVLDNYFNNTLNLMGGNVLYISKYPGVRVGDGSEYRNRQNITFDQFEKLQERVRYARSINPIETFSYTEIQYGEKKTDPNKRVTGTNQYYIPNNAYNIQSGRNFTEDDINKARKVIIIGEDIRKELFDTQDALNKEILIDGQRYKIIALLEAKGTTLGESNDDMVIIPYTTGLSIYGGGRRDINIQVAAPNMTLVNETMDELIGVLRTIRKVEPGKPNDFEIETNNSLKSFFNQFTGMLFLFGFVVGGIALLGAGIGVTNIMLVSVTERTREIGVRKAIGATRRAIIFQFLAEAVMICQIGGIIGLVIGIIGGNMMAVAFEIDMVFPWMAAIGGIFGLTIIGLISGVIPAVKASRLDPIESLRYE